MAEYIEKEHFGTRVRLAVGMAGEEEFTEDFKDGVLTVLELLKTEEKSDVVEQEKIDEAIDEVYKIRKDVLYANGCYEPNDVLDIIDKITKLFEEV